MQDRHHRCFCHLEVFLSFFAKMLIDTPEHNDLIASYLIKIKDITLDFPDCHPPPGDDDNYDYDSFGWEHVQLFCRNRKNATMIRLMRKYANTCRSGHYPTMLKFADVDDCVREGIIYHDAYDALEKEVRAKAIIVLFCTKRILPKDLREMLGKLIADCSENNLHMLPELGLLFKPNQGS